MDPRIVKRGGYLPQQQASSSQDEQNRSAAADVVRAQINALYGDNAVAEPTQTTTAQTTTAAPVATDATSDAWQDSTNPYNRSHVNHPQPQAEQWKTYHTAWQNYYQQYYQAYYIHQTKQQEQRRLQQIQEQITQQNKAAIAQNFFANQPDDSEEAATSSSNSNSNSHAQLQSQSQSQSQAQTNKEEDITKDRALSDIRERLRTKVQERAKKVKSSRHFIPIVASLSVVLVFLFLQYNSIIFGIANAYTAPGAINPQNIVVEPTDDATVSSDPRLIIPKINVDVPVIYNVGSDYDSQMAAMTQGVAHFSIPGANSHPGEVGNTVLSGHSSNDLFDTGDYKFIFAQLDKLETGDTVYVHYNSVRYIYTVTKKEVVKPTEVSKLIYDTDKPMLTLITCTPLGTSLNRLLVTAEQISPDPSEANTSTSSSTSDSSDDSDSSTSSTSSIPGNSQTLLEKLFGKSED